MRTGLKVTLLAFVLSFSALGVAIAESPLPMQSSNQASVTVKVTPRDLASSVWAFEVVFDTHTQPLTDDLGKTAVLVSDGVSSKPIKWEGDPPGGHHRKGVLQFTAVSPMPAAIELQIRRSGESAPRLFRWKLK